MKKWIAIIGIILLGLIVVALGGGYVWFQYAINKSLPKMSGEVVVSGLKEDIEIIRDTFGVPHIYAKNEPDLFFGCGFAMAQDRLWQMEFTRRLGQGRLSEVLGKDLVKADRFFRMLASGGTDKKIPEELAFVSRSFADGVNAFLEAHPDRLPFEFTILGYKPEPWAPKDSLAIMRVGYWSGSMGWRVDLTARKVLEKVGVEKMKEAFPIWPKDGPLIIAGEDKDLSKITHSFFETMRFAESLTGSSIGSARFGKRTLEEIIALSLKQMFSELKEVMGSDLNKWTWGELHSLTFEHVLGSKKPLSWIFNLGPFPVGGSKLTINMSHYPYGKPFHTNLGVSMRMIVDLSNPGGSFHVLPTGESGHIGSPHHKDQIDLYLSGKYRIESINRLDVEKNSESVMILKPKFSSKGGKQG